MGLLCLREKRFARAIGFLEDALAAKPGDAEILSNLGMALSAVGRHDEALAAYDGAIAQSPGVAFLHYDRGNTLQSLGRAVEAIEAYDAALALQPAFAEALANRGNSLRQIGRDQEALTSYDRALTLNPRLVEALFSRVSLLARHGRLLEALADVNAALAIDNASTHGYLTRADLHKRLGKPEAALADLTQAVSVEPRNAVALTLRGDQLAALERNGEALKSFQMAIEVDPGFAEAYDRLGCALVEVGRIEEARLAHERAVALAPRKPGFFYNLCAVTELDALDPRFLVMSRMALEPEPLAAEERIALHFALSKAYSDQGNFKAAFQHMKQGNALKRAEIAYDERATLADMRTIRALFDADLLAEHGGRGHESTKPVFIVGMPRSGSTLVEQILASHPCAHGAGESSDFVAAAVDIVGENLGDLAASDARPEVFRDQLQRIGASYVQRIRARHGDADRIVNKMLDNFRFVGLIHLALPDARIIHVRRDPLDTCISCFSKMFSANIPYAYDLVELGRYYRAYDGLMAHWRKIIPSRTLLEIRYEDLVADPEANARRIVAHCGLEWDSRSLDFHRNARPVRTASAVQVRKPIYTDAVARWTKFAAYVTPLILALGPIASRNFLQWGDTKSLWRRLRMLLYFPRRSRKMSSAG